MYAARSCELAYEDELVAKLPEPPAAATRSFAVFFVQLAPTVWFR